MGRRVFVFASSLVTLAALPVRSQCGYDWKPGQCSPGTDYYIDSVVSWDPDGPEPLPPVIVASGWFHHAGGGSIEYVAAWDGEKWTQLGTDSLEQPKSLIVWHGELIAFGYFNWDTHHERVVRWNGTAWEPLGDAPWEGSIGRLGIFADDLVLFTYAQGSVKSFILHGLNWDSLASDLPSGDINGICTFHNDLIVCGSFWNHYSDDPPSFIARWDGASWQPLGDPREGPLTDVIVFEDNLIASGAVSPANGAAINGTGRWNGSVWQGMPTTTGSGQFDKLVTMNGTLYGVGRIGSGVDDYRLCKWDGSTWQPEGFGLDGQVNTLAAHRDAIVAGGSFWYAHNPSSHFVTDSYKFIACWEGGAWRPVGNGLGSGQLQSFANYQGTLIAGGGFSYTGGTHNLNIAQWSGSYWSELEDDFVHYINGESLTLFAGNLIAGADDGFLGKWNGANWESICDCIEGEISAVTTYKDDLVVGGYVDSPFTGIGRWDGKDWHDFGLGIEGYVDLAIELNGDLIAAGQFTTADGLPVKNVARWNGTSWSPMGSGLGIDPSNEFANCAVIYDGMLVVGGLFEKSGDTIVNSIAKWDGSSWQPMGLGMDYTINALRVYNGELYAGGLFKMAGTHEVDFIARWDGVDWQPVGGGLDNWVYSLFEYRGDLIVGGEFTHAGRISSQRWARFGPIGPTPLFSQQPVSPAVCANSALSLNASAIGEGTLSYQWQKAGQDLIDSADVFGTQTDTLVLAHAQPADSGPYTCVVKLNNCTQATSNVAALTVYAGGSADGNADGVVDARDIQTFVDALTGFSPVSTVVCAYDLTGDGIVTIDDVPPFVARLLY